MSVTTSAPGSEVRVPRSFWQVAREPRMITLLAVFLVIAAVCGFLGNWQLDRAHQRAHLAATQERVEAEAGGAEPLAELLVPQQTFPGELVGRSALVTGTYEPAGQAYVTGRTVGGRTGYLVLTPLRVSDDGSAGASWAQLSGPPVLPVVRGWVADLDEVQTLAPPTGSVTLTVYLQASEAAAEAPDRPGEVVAISSAQLLATWEGPIYSGYGVIAQADPASPSALVLLPRPVIDGGDGLNLRNIFYAIEWWIFAGFAVLMWLRLVRDAMRGGRDPLASHDPLAVNDPLAVPEKSGLTDSRP